MGGTNTDAALLNGNTVLGSCKVATTADVTSGVCESIVQVLEQTSVNPTQVTTVMVGTTHFLNALVQRKDLSRTATLRLCGPTSRALPPMIDWPKTKWGQGLTKDIKPSRRIVFLIFCRALTP